jgi:energy-coupling factor transporter ATP-binding protein EcfA2
VDPISRRDFWDLIGGLATRGTTVFVSTHYMEEAEYCHRLALMNRGRIIALDRPAVLRAAMPSPLIELATDDGPRAVETLAGADGVIDVGLFGRAVHVTVRDLEAARTAWSSPRSRTCSWRWCTPRAARWRTEAPWTGCGSSPSPARRSSSCGVTRAA